MTCPKCHGLVIDQQDSQYEPSYLKCVNCGWQDISALIAHAHRQWVAMGGSLWTEDHRRHHRAAMKVAAARRCKRA